jgi:phage tail tape-measure protein
VTFQNIPYLYQNKNGSFRVLTKGVDEYFKATEKDKAIKFAKNFQKKLDKEIKGFLTRQQLGEKLGIKDLTIERAKKVNSKLWNEISNQMEIKKVGSREYYKFKGKEKDAILQ